MSRRSVLECDQCGPLGEREGKAQLDFFQQGHEYFWPGHHVTVRKVSRPARRGGPRSPLVAQAAGSPSSGRKTS